MNSAYTIRTINRENLKQSGAMELVWRVFLEFEAPDYSEEGIQEFKRFIDLEEAAQRMDAGEMLLWGCFGEERLVGVIAGRLPGHVSLLFVDKKYHRQGIARALYHIMVDYYRAGGCCEITVNSSPYAVEAYRRLGFVETGPEQTVNGLRFTPMKHTFRQNFSVSVERIFKLMKNKTPLPNIYLAVVLILTYIPILLVVLYSFNASRISSVWEGFSLHWYRELFRDRSMFEALRNSLILAALSSISAAVIGTLGAVGMARTSYKANGVIEYISTLPIMIPEIILGMVFLVFFALIGLPFGMFALVIGHTTFCIPYVFMTVKARLAGMDKSYVEAAKDLGASEMRAFVDITFPLMRPAIASGMMLSFSMSLDDVIISMFLSNAHTNTLPIKIYTQLKTGVTPKTNALCALIFFVTLLMGVGSFLMAQRKKYNA